MNPLYVIIFGNLFKWAGVKVIRALFPQQGKLVEPEKAIEDPQIVKLKGRKKQIQDTMEQYNTTDTFVKYSKMQRELMKIEGKLEDLLKDKEQKPMEQKQRQKDASNSTRHLSSLLQDRVLFYNGISNVILLIYSFTVSVEVNQELAESMFGFLTSVQNQKYYVNGLLFSLAFSFLFT